jgi:hypothetical protein
MPAVLASSVVVVSAERAHRMQRSTSTEAMGRGLESILEEADDEEETSESDEEADPKLWLESNAAAGIFCWGCQCDVDKSCKKAESVDGEAGEAWLIYLDACLLPESSVGVA